MCVCVAVLQHLPDFTQGQYGYGGSSGAPQQVIIATLLRDGIRSSYVTVSVHLLLPLTNLVCVHCLQTGSSYGTGHQGVSSQATQQPQTYGASSSSYPAADQQGYTAGQTDYNSAQQVLITSCVIPRRCYVHQAVFSLTRHASDMVRPKWDARRFERCNSTTIWLEVSHIT